VNERFLIDVLCHFLLQQTSDNAENVKELERRVHSLSGMLASPVSEDDYAEKTRRVVLRRFVPLRTYVNLLIPLSGSSRRLSRNLNRSPTNMGLSGSYATSITPKL
jgi:hypothetical protein